MGWAHQPATPPASGATTNKAVGQPTRERRLVRYSGQLFRCSTSRDSCTSTTMAKHGLPSSSSTTRSARYSVGTT